MVQPSLLFLSAIALPYAAASTLPVVGRNDYNVAISTAVLTDTGRLDPFAKDGSRRKIMLSSFSPIASCRRKNLQDYMPAATGDG
jgi:hypothetical protein